MLFRSNQSALQILGTTIGGRFSYKLIKITPISAKHDCSHSLLDLGTPLDSTVQQISAPPRDEYLGHQLGRADAVGCFECSG